MEYNLNKSKGGIILTEALSLGFIQKLLKSKADDNREIEKELKKLYAERSKVREELEISMNNYNHVTEEGLMDFYIYQIRSQQVLEQYLIREIRRIEKEKTA